jgi:hypothetical protein
MTFRVPVRQAPESSGIAGTTRDLQEQFEQLFGHLLTVSSVPEDKQVPPLPVSGIRLFKLGDPQVAISSTDLIQLRPLASNLIPHPLGRPVREAILTPVVTPFLSLLNPFFWALSDPSKVFPNLPPEKNPDPNKFCNFVVSDVVTVRIRVR